MAGLLGMASIFDLRAGKQPNIPNPVTPVVSAISPVLSTDKEGTMQLGVLIFVVADVKNYLVERKLMDDTGKFTQFQLTNYGELAGVVVNSLKAHGVTIQAEIDKVVQGLPLLLSLFGK